MESLADLRAALPGFAFNDYLRHLKAAERLATSGTPLRVAVLRSYTVEPMEPVLRLRLIADGFQPRCWFGGYNQYVQDILDPAGELRAFRPNMVLLLVRLEELMPEFMDAFPDRAAADWGSLLESRARELAALAGRVSAELSAQVIVQNASLTRPCFGVFDAQQHDGQSDAVRRYNRALIEAAGTASGVFVWDFDRFVKARGAEQLYDPKSWYVSRNPFRQAAYPVLVDDLMRYARSALGQTKKVVVLDLDNTLWGGIVGEDGFDGIRLDNTYPGNCYRDFQRELLKLYHRGILLAINSKNNEADALRVIDDHPDMVLRRHHFAAMRINWQDKATNLRELVRALNVGMESVVFVDDNPAECALVRQQCPECDVVLLPDKPYLVPTVVDALPGIENIRLTAEDRRKGEMYRVRLEQAEQQAQFANVDEFLRSLDMEVEIAPASSFSVPRIAQLTQKTNQWNMTTRRYSEAQIAAFTSDPAHGVFSVAARDRFGDHGIIGVCILTWSGGECVIDTFLLSCRVIGRGIEQAMMSFVVDQARSRGLQRLSAEFVPTRKNAPALGFYERVGLFKTADTWYGRDLAEFVCSVPSHIRCVHQRPAGSAVAPTRKRA
jgi:FkbH-like protein